MTRAEDTEAQAGSRSWRDGTAVVHRHRRDVIAGWLHSSSNSGTIHKDILSGIGSMDSYARVLKLCNSAGMNFQAASS